MILANLMMWIQAAQPDVAKDLIMPLVVVLTGGLISGTTKYVLMAYEKFYAPLPARAKQCVVIIISFLFMKLNATIGTNLPLEPTSWSADLWNTIIFALSAFGLHNLVKKKTT